MVLDLDCQLLAVIRFGYVVHRACFQPFFSTLRVFSRGEEDDRNGWREDLFLEDIERLETIQPRHFYVEENEIRVFLFRSGDGLVS